MVLCSLSSVLPCVLQSSDGDDTVPPDEVAALVADADTTLTPPSEYVAIWVKVASAEERIARAKEQHEAGVSTSGPSTWTSWLILGTPRPPGSSTGGSPPWTCRPAR